MLEAIAITAGLVVGSFLNVCIARLPEGESVVHPPSHCPSCKKPIAWYDNIPLLSYLILRGRCRTCKGHISLRYPLVEATTAVLALLLLQAGLEPRTTLLFFALACALLVVTFIDIDQQIIPDAITLPSILVAPAAAFFIGHISIVDSLVGILSGGGLLWGIAKIYALLRKQEGMGLGDVKLLAMIGGFLGWQAVLFTLVVGSVAGTLIGLFLIALRRGRLDMAIPFGPFLGFGAVLHMLAGPALVRWYFALPLLF